MNDTILDSEKNEYNTFIEHVLEYVKEKYDPKAIMLYGSYASFDYNENSDLDMFIVVDKKEKNHDNSKIDGVELDLFIFTKDEIMDIENLDVLLTAYDGIILKDSDNILSDLKDRVRKYVFDNTDLGDDEIEFIRNYIVKTISRSKNNDLDSKFRLINLLSESLANYCLLRRKFYFGSKKTIKYLIENDIYGYELFENALKNKGYHDIIDWLFYCIELPQDE